MNHWNWKILGKLCMSVIQILKNISKKLANATSSDPMLHDQPPGQKPSSS
jgi:hypothetical protein